MKLVPMTQEKFEIYIKRAIPHLGQEISRSRNISEKEGLKISHDSFSKLFPEKAVNSPDQYVSELQVGDTIVGFIHFGIRFEENRPFGFIWDFEIYPEFRRQGFGQKALGLCETELQKNERQPYWSQCFR